MIKKLLRTLLGEGVEVEISDGLLIVKHRSRYYGVKYLVGEEVDYGFKDLDQKSVYRIVEAYTSLYSRLPVGTEFKIVKLGFDKKKFTRRLENEMVNIKAVLETTMEPHLVKRFEKRLKILERLYQKIICLEDIERIMLVVKIHGVSSDRDSLVENLETHAGMVKNLFHVMLGIELKSPGKNVVKRIIEYELGLTGREPRIGKAIVVEAERIATLQPIPYSKKPLVEEMDGVYIGYDIETGWPVVIDRKALYKHILVVGPTGRGKTVTLASIIENLVGIGGIDVIAMDYKGDLAGLLDDETIRILTPDDTPLNILVRPDYIPRVDWILIVNDLLCKILGIDSRRASSILNVVVDRGKAMEYSDPEKLLLDKDLSILASVIEIVANKPSYDKLLDIITSESILVDLHGYGVAYQNLYGGLLLSIVSYLVSTGKLYNRVIVVDEAWRITRLKALYSLVKEGRSRRIGVVIATQNIEDVPEEVIDNIHTVIAFGSYSDSYTGKLRELLGLRESYVEKLKRLGVGEAIILSSIDQHPVYVRIEPPTRLEEKERVKQGVVRIL